MLPVKLFAFAILAGAVKIEGMITNVKVHQVGDGILNLLDAGVTKFDNLPAILTNQVIMLFALIGFFKLGDVLPKLMFDHQVAFQQQFNGIVQGSATDPVVFILHADVKRLYVEVVVPGVNFVQNGVSLGCFPMPTFFQVACENFFDSVFSFTTHHSTEHFNFSIKLG